MKKTIILTENISLMIFFKFKIALINLKQDITFSKISYLWFPLTFLIVFMAKIFLFADIFDSPKELYGPYIAIGLSFWIFFSNCLRISLMLFNNNSLIRNIYISPNDHLDIIFIQNSLIYLGNMVIVLAICFFFDSEFNFFLFFIALITTSFLTYNAVKLACSFVMFSYDFAKLVSSSIIILFFLTPIIWYPSSIDLIKQKILLFNPLFHVLNLLRDAMMFAKLNFVSFIIVALLAILFFFINFFLINRYVQQKAAKR
jgi:ABC-type polysaccharide/polyol phosphate export permease